MDSRLSVKKFLFISIPWISLTGEITEIGRDKVMDKIENNSENVKIEVLFNRQIRADCNINILTNNIN